MCFNRTIQLPNRYKKCNLLLTSIVKADEKKISDLEKRISQLESNKLSIPKGLFITGEVEGYYDDRTYDSGLDTRAELQIGITHKFNNHYVNWTGASMLYDTYYSLDTTLNNTVQTKLLITTTFFIKVSNFFTLSRVNFNLHFLYKRSQSSSIYLNLKIDL